MRGDERDLALARGRSNAKRAARKLSGLCVRCGLRPLRCKNFCAPCGDAKNVERRLQRKSVVREPASLSIEERYALLLLRPTVTTQEAIGHAMRLSRARVQQIETAALRKMATVAKSIGLSLDVLVPEHGPTR